MCSRQGVATSLGRLAGGTFSQANYVNTFGVAVGDGDTGNGRPQGWVETSTGPYNLPEQRRQHAPLFVGDNGFIGGYYTKSLSGNTASWRGAIWTVDPKDPRKYRETDLPILPGGINTKLSSAAPFAFSQQGRGGGLQRQRPDRAARHVLEERRGGAHHRRSRRLLRRRLDEPRVGHERPRPGGRRKPSGTRQPPGDVE